MTLFAVFDVEAIGLHGEGFAVGFVVVDSVMGKELEAGLAGCDYQYAMGTEKDRRWIEENVPQRVLETITHDTARALREAFWQKWGEWARDGVMVAADVPWPVEARFLSDCVRDKPPERSWKGPYPLIDIASVRLAAGLDPLATEPRLSSEMPAHDPQMDARQSARLLLEALSKIALGQELLDIAQSRVPYDGPVPLCRNCRFPLGHHGQATACPTPDGWSDTMRFRSP